jgi:hypothetical protein
MDIVEKFCEKRSKTIKFWSNGGITLTWYKKFKKIEQKGMTFDHEFC